MHTLRTTLSILGLGPLALLALPAMASLYPEASPGEFAGSRAEVRTFCTGEGRHLLEGSGYSLCVTATSDVLCRDGEACNSTDVSLIVAEGFRPSAAIGLPSSRS